jgi:hypothetical protein
MSAVICRELTRLCCVTRQRLVFFTSLFLMAPNSFKGESMRDYVVDRLQFFILLYQPIKVLTAGARAFLIGTVMERKKEKTFI